MKRKGTSIHLQYGDDYDPRSIESRARLHEQHRGRTVASILAELNLMAVADILPANCIIDANKAYWQDFTGSEARGTQAAHCAPCQITITGRRPEQYVRKYSPQRAGEIAAMFGKTDKFLPTIFNQCDSRAERVKNGGQDVGLVPAFWDACLNTVNSGRFGAGFEFKSIVKDIRAAYYLYASMAEQAYITTITEYQKDYNWYSMRTTHKDEAKEIAAKMKIVGYYLDELRKFDAVEMILKFGEISDSINQYQSFVK